ncbi:hypothetical protein MHU86_23064 [Fragilaria crotonensis]|nr:hypothetical protein MHU86_23064 [Fragilaria crotonensis]
MEGSSFPLHDEYTIRISPPYQDGAIVRHIASFLTLSDAASMGASSHNNLAQVGSWSSFVKTPETPGLMALSPDEHGMDDDAVGYTFDDDLMHQRLQDRQRRYVTQKLAAAVFAHPQSLRQFCVKAHKAATDIQKSRELSLRHSENHPNNPTYYSSSSDQCSKMFHSPY